MPLRLVSRAPFSQNSSYSTGRSYKVSFVGSSSWAQALSIRAPEISVLGHFSMYLHNIPSLISSSPGFKHHLKVDAPRLFFFFFLAAPLLAYRILVSQPGIEPMAPAVEVQNLNHWATRNVPRATKISILGLDRFLNSRRHPPSALDV